jgi:hypothetical protein
VGGGGVAILSDRFELFVSSNANLLRFRRNASALTPARLFFCTAILGFRCAIYRSQ